MLRPVLVLFLALGACKRSTAPPPAPETPPTAAPSEEALDHYTAFSDDGLLFAWTEPGASVFVTRFLASTTNTVEKAVPLESDATRRRVVDELAEEGFPPPGQRLKLPPEVGVVVSDGIAQVTFAGMPAAKPWRPFESRADVRPVQAQVVAVSNDGRWVAVRTTGADSDSSAPPVEHRVVALFE